MTVVLMLLFLECVVGGSNVTNLITMIMQIIKLLVDIFQTLISFPKKKGLSVLMGFVGLKILAQVLLSNSNFNLLHS